MGVFDLLDQLGWGGGFNSGADYLSWMYDPAAQSTIITNGDGSSAVLTP